MKRERNAATSSERYIGEIAQAVNAINQTDTRKLYEALRAQAKKARRSRISNRRRGQGEEGRRRPGRSGGRHHRRARRAWFERGDDDRRRGCPTRRRWALQGRSCALKVNARARLGEDEEQPNSSKPPR